MNIPLPCAVRTAMEKLNNAGYEAYIVGGCVRDFLRGITPSDYDMTTSALPEQTAEVLSEYRIIETGMKHGTVTALIDGEPIEITTFRVDGEYEDHRRPREVSFTRSLKEDLARRDFTVNAMAYSPNTGIVDLFGGREDIESGVIRAVGDPDKRFDEDALRILRAMRFSSVTDFAIEEQTGAAMIRKAALLSDISAERIWVELSKLLLGVGCVRVLSEYAVILTQIIPELAPCIGFDQRNPHHVYDVYRHTVEAVGNCPKDLCVRVAALLHDIGKPSVFAMGSDGLGHFYGHSERSCEIADRVLSRLKTDNATKHEVLTLIKYHDPVIAPDRATVGRWLRRLGVDTLSRLLELKAADNLAQSPRCHGRVETLREIRGIVDELLEEQACFSLRHLAVRGDDLIKEVGMPAGKAIGKTLSLLLDAVICGELPNEKQKLLERAKEIAQKMQTAENKK